MPLDAANTAGLALGSLNSLGQLVGGSIRILEGYHKAQNLATDAMEAQIDLEFAWSRLKSWASDWGIEQGLHLKNKRFVKYGQEAINYLVWINYRLLELSKTDGSTSSTSICQRSLSGCMRIIETTSEQIYHTSTPVIGFASNGPDVHGYNI
jgi:hypothetical protein